MNVSVPLANDGYFIAKQESLGVTERDLADAVRGAMTADRQRAIQICADEAIIALARAEAKGRC